MALKASPQGSGDRIRVGSLVEGARVCLRRLGNHGKWLSIRLIRRIAGTVPSSPLIAITSVALHRRRAEHASPGFPGLRIACRAHARHDGDGVRRRARRRVVSHRRGPWWWEGRSACRHHSYSVETPRQLSHAAVTRSEAYFDVVLGALTGIQTAVGVSVDERGSASLETAAKEVSRRCT